GRGELLGLLGERRVLAGQLLGGRQIGARLLQLLRGLVHRGELGEAPPHPARGGRIGVDRRVRELLLQLRILVEERGETFTAHARTPIIATGWTSTAERRHRRQDRVDQDRVDIARSIPRAAPATPTAPARAEPQDGRRRRSYLAFLFLAWTLAYFCWNFATRPAVSRTRCLPV